MSGEWTSAPLRRSPPTAIALARADTLDAERTAGRVRSGLHGIPIIVKDNFATHLDLGMDTTCGTVALRGARPKQHL
jgi:amidase